MSCDELHGRKNCIGTLFGKKLSTDGVPPCMASKRGARCPVRGDNCKIECTHEGALARSVTEQGCDFHLCSSWRRCVCCGAGLVQATLPRYKDIHGASEEATLAMPNPHQGAKGSREILSTADTCRYVSWMMTCWRRIDLPPWTYLSLYIYISLTLTHSLQRYVIRENACAILRGNCCYHSKAGL